MRNYPFDEMEEDKKNWAKQTAVPASFIENLERQMMSRTKMDTEMIERNSGRGMWKICRNPTCYRGDIIDKAVMEEQILYEKGTTILFIGRVKAEDA
eukprot:15762532-Heterocapsa_arctica.AAC.1